MNLAFHAESRSSIRKSSTLVLRGMNNPSHSHSVITHAVIDQMVWIAFHTPHPDVASLGLLETGAATNKRHLGKTRKSVVRGKEKRRAAASLS